MPIEIRTDPGSLGVEVVTADVLGHPRKTLWSLRWQEWTFLVVSVLSVSASIGLTLERLISFAPNAMSSASVDFAFALLLLINTVFCVYYVFSGLLRERLFEMYMYIASVLVILLYCAIEYGVHTSKHSLIKLVRLVLASVLAPVNILLAILVLRSFGWLEFRVVGASETLQTMYRQRNLFFSFLAFDLQAATSFLTLSLTNGEQMTTASIIGVSLGLPLSLGWAFLGSGAVKRELLRLCWVFAALGLLIVAWVFASSIMLLVDKDTDQKDTFLTTATLVAGCLVILVRAILMYELWNTAKNFSHGLKDSVFNFEAVTYDIHHVRDLCHCCY